MAPANARVGIRGKHHAARRIKLPGRLNQPQHAGGLQVLLVRRNPEASRLSGPRILPHENEMIQNHLVPGRRLSHAAVCFDSIHAYRSFQSVLFKC